VIADSIELVGRGYMFDAMVALAGCDKTIPGRRWVDPIECAEPRAVWRIDSAGAVSRTDVTIQDVLKRWEHIRREKLRMRIERDRKCRVSRSGGVRRAVHGEYDGDGAGIHWANANGFGQRARH